jgi:hypothetical protein
MSVEVDTEALIVNFHQVLVAINRDSGTKGESLKQKVRIGELSR